MEFRVLGVFLGFVSLKEDEMLFVFPFWFFSASCVWRLMVWDRPLCLRFLF